MVARKARASCCVSPMPESVTRRVEPSASKRMQAGQPGSISRRAEMASVPFCRSSRTKTCGPE